MKRVLLTLTLVLLARATHADTIVITSGQITYDGGPFGVLGIEMQGERFSGSLGAPVIENAFAAASAIVGPSTTTVANSGALSRSGSFTHDGAVYQVTPISASSVFVEFSGPAFVMPAVRPAFGEPDFTLFSTFALSGFFNGSLSGPGGCCVQGTLTGGGIASVTMFALNPEFFNGVQLYQTRSALYTFQTPEPTSLFLIGAGLVGVLRRMRRQIK